jgi:hypothetical protein
MQATWLIPLKINQINGLKNNPAQGARILREVIGF